ncbi:MAG: zf-HC2 domain-containing protein [Chlamydiota bacterium]
MRCHRIERLLSDYLDGVLAPARRAAVAAHLENCPSCAASLSRLERTCALVRGGARVPDPGDDYWTGFWPRMKEQLGRAEEPRPSPIERLRRLLFPGRLAGVFSPVPAMVILALVCFNVLLLTQMRRGAPGSAVPSGAARDRDAAERRFASLAARGGSMEISRRAGSGSGVDAVLCDSGGRAGIDEYVLQPAAFRRSARGPKMTDYIITRAVEPSPRSEPRWAY